MGKRNTLKTKTGFEYVVDANMGDDMELLELLTQLDGGDATVLPAVLTKILGEKQKKKLYEHCREKDGRVPFSAVSKEIADIFNANNALKK